MIWRGNRFGMARPPFRCERRRRRNHAEWKQSRDQATIDGEIDLDARNNPDEWNVYLMGAPQTNKVRRKNFGVDRRKPLQPFRVS